ncbi:MAG: sucrase ferredoxin [Phototrophicaceae bacterium]
MVEQLSADLARQNNEPLYGTIKSSDVWLLLEYNGVYTQQAWEDARIPDAVKAKLDAFPNGHPLLIRQPDQVYAHDRLTSLFIVDAAHATPAIYHLKLQSYQDILDIDLEAVRAGTVVDASNEPLYVICTNGKRDVCCSKYGIALYNAMVAKAQHHVWQSSHIGGHRFAGTMYCFPDAICYGFLQPEDAGDVVQSYSHRRLLLDKLRGHAIYDKPIQAAEYFLRRELNNSDLDAVVYQNDVQDTDVWFVTFSVEHVAYKVTLQAAPSIQVLATTGDEFLKDIPQFKLVDVKQLP